MHDPDSPLVAVQVAGVQHWMSAGPGQCPGSDAPPWAEQEDVEMHVPGAPLFILQVVGVEEGGADEVGEGV
jgi:hypothetical protein